MNVGGLGTRSIGYLAYAAAPAAAKSLIAVTSKPEGAATHVETSRQDELLQLISQFSPTDVNAALLMANTTYQLSSASPSVTAAEISAQLASHRSAIGFQAYENAVTSSVSGKLNLNA